MRVAPRTFRFLATLILFSQLAQGGGGASPPFPPIVFVSRHVVPPELAAGSCALPGFGPHWRTIKVGGTLMLRKADGSVSVLADRSLFFDVADPAVSWDGRSILFSGVTHRDSSWRIYRINADGSGCTQLTFSNRAIELAQFGPASSAFIRYDDFDPCWLPDGRIVFASTRHPSMASVGAVRTSNLYVMNVDGSGLHRITSERNGAEEPAIDPVTGRIVFARWWVNVDRPSDVTREGLAREDHLALTEDRANIWHAMSVNPDGSLLKLYAGFPRTRAGTQTYKPAVMPDGKLLSTFTRSLSLTPTIGGTGIRWFKPGVDFEHPILGVQSDDDTSMQNGIPTPCAADPAPLSKSAILCSYSRDGQDFGIYACSPDGSGLRKVVDLPGTHELEPQALVRRRVPPVIPDAFPEIASELPPTEDPATYYINDAFRFDCMNVFTNGAVDEPMPDAPVITKGAKIKFFMNVQRRNIENADPSILIKSVDVLPGGGVHEPDVPADVPLFEQLVDSAGRVLRTSSNGFAHVTGMNYERIGGGTKCVGCHAGHSTLTVPINGSVAEWFNAAPSARVSASSFWITPDGKAYSPQRAVDRQAQAGGDSVIWVANEASGSTITLRWDTPIEIREVKLYGITSDRASGTNSTIQDAEIRLYYKLREVGKVKSTGIIRPNGTRIKVPVLPVDALTVVVKKFFGTVRRQPLPGLAEVETIARIY
jgi:hypothetical protein